ncbi:MAG: alpha/beta fold hydrolase [Pseudomonadota bacterium]|nr:alpha/beta fold hydrolase [Pseudomonadota bacterium]
MPLRRFLFLLRCAFAAAGLLLAGSAAHAADYPAPVERDWIARDFRFHTGEVMPELRLHVTTVGAPSGEPVLILHGTAGSAAGLLVPTFAGELFGPGQPLDASKYFIILPDAIGTGKSAKPSDGLRSKFPHYDYDDMVEAQFRLVSEGLGVRHLRLVLGNSMGGMHTWLWGEKHPQFMDALMPMACQPTEMAGRNWMLRRLFIESIRNDPGWQGGNYTTQPRSLAFANVYFGVATSGGSQAYHQAAPTRELADKLIDSRLAAPYPLDANDTLYQWESSVDYNAAPGLERIEAMLVAINAADDERNPPELMIMEREMKRVKHGRFVLIPASTETRGHGTTGLAKFIRQPVQSVLREAPRRPI